MRISPSLSMHAKPPCPRFRASLPSATLALFAAAASEGAVISFQQGISPTTGYNMGVVDIGNGITGGNNAQFLAGGFSGTPGVPNANHAGFARSLFEIDLTALETAAGGNPVTINSVSLTLWPNSHSGLSTINTLQLDLLTLSQDFDEGTVTWSNYSAHSAGITQVGTQTFASTDIANGTSVTYGNTAAFVTAVNNALASSDNTLRLVLRTTTTFEDSNNSRFIRFWSDDVTSTSMSGAETGDPDYRPTLTINYTVVPEPTASLLVLSGLGLVLARRQRRLS